MLLGLGWRRRWIYGDLFFILIEGVPLSVFLLLSIDLCSVWSWLVGWRFASKGVTLVNRRGGFRKQKSTLSMLTEMLFEHLAMDA